jgi:hypothetical protein
MFQHIFEKRILKELAGIMILLNAVVLVLSLVIINRNAQTIQEVHQEIVELREKVEEEIKLREELFTTLRKSASLLQKYNPRLDNLTAYKYACKIYECSEPPVTPELGLTQVMPTIWQYQKQELLNPYRNIEIGSKILKNYIDRHGIKGGLSSYNSGRKNRSLRYARYVLDVAGNH